MILIQLNLPFVMEFLMPLIFVILHRMQNVTSVGEENFDWVVETAANFAIEKAQAHEEGKDNLNLGRICKKKRDARMKLNLNMISKIN